MSMRFTAAINKPGYNPYAQQVSGYLYNLYAWGYNTNGQLGLGNTTPYSSPKQVGTLTNWSQISGSTALTSVKTDGTLWAWGRNTFGELGTGNTTYYSSPKQIGALTNWKYVSTANGTTLAVKTDGTLWAWGKNAFGQIGLNNRTYYSSPKQVGLLTNWALVQSGDSECSHAIKTDGTLWSWGDNFYGQLGLGNTTRYSSPKQVGALTNWLKLQPCGGNALLAIKTDGTLWACGQNSSGQLGLGNTTNYSSVKQIGALTTWSTIASGTNTVLATRTDGTLWGWGVNAYGQLGNGTINNYSSPKQIGALTTWNIVSCTGGSSTGAIKTDGTLWTWGINSSGQLGLGNNTYYSSPKQVGSSTTWQNIIAGAATIAIG